MRTSTDRVERTLLQGWSPDFWDWGLHQLQNFFQGLLQPLSLLIKTKQHKLLQKDVYVSCRRNRSTNSVLNNTGVLNKQQCCSGIKAQERAANQNWFSCSYPDTAVSQYKCEPILSWHWEVLMFLNLQMSRARTVRCSSQQRQINQIQVHHRQLMYCEAPLPSIPIRNKREHAAPVVCALKLESRLKSPYHTLHRINGTDVFSQNFQKGHVFKRTPLFQAVSLALGLAAVLWGSPRKGGCLILLCTARGQSEGKSAMFVQLLTWFPKLFSKKGLPAGWYVCVNLFNNTPPVYSVVVETQFSTWAGKLYNLISSVFQQGESIGPRTT